MNERQMVFYDDMTRVAQILARPHCFFFALLFDDGTVSDSVFFL